MEEVCITNCAACATDIYSSGDISIPGDVLVESDLNGASPQFTLTCISTGGPATTVTWTRDSTTVTQGTQTVLNNPVTAQYTHTLTVTVSGAYTCIVSNAKPSTASASITLGISLHHYKIFWCFNTQDMYFCRSIASHWRDSSPGWSN